MDNLLKELQSRKVFRVLVAYAFVAWVIAQMADIGAETFAAPEWVMQLLIIVLLMGLPVAALLAWAFEMTPEGVKRDTTSPAGRQFAAIIISLTVLGGFAYFWYSPQKTAGDDYQNVSVPQSQENDGSPPASLESESETEFDPSIAVLPFENFSQDSADQYFADGLADTLLHKLSQLGGIKVIARNSSFQYKGSNRDVREIGAALGVATILEGSVQRQGDQIRIIAQLVKTSDGAHIWSESFDDRMDNIFEVQDRIAAAIAERLQDSLSIEDRERIFRNGTDNPKAYDLLMLAINANNEFGGTLEPDPEDNSAIILTRQALQLDPEYAYAWANLSYQFNTYAFMQSNSDKYAEYAALARQYAEKSIEIDPTLDHGHVALGFADWRVGNANAALRSYRRALELNPNNTGAMSGLGLALLSSDPEESLRLFRKSSERNPGAFLPQRQIAIALQQLGRTDESITALKNAVERWPEIQIFYDDLASIYSSSKGRHDLALQWFSRLLSIEPKSNEALTGMMNTWLRVGDYDRARDWLQALEKSSPDSDDAKYGKVILALVNNDTDAVGTMLLDFPTSGFGIREKLKFSGVLCLISENRDCLVSTSDQLELMNDQLESMGLGFLMRSSINVTLFRAASTDDPETFEDDLRRHLADVSSWPATPSSQGRFIYLGYLRPLIHTALGEKDEAVSALEETLTLPDGGIIGSDITGLPPDRSPLLSDLTDLPGFQVWLSRFDAKRNVMRQRMIQMENEGTAARALPYQ
jgi:TolB-like protein/Tfp pilus assembly protein PilF